jgi:hypothetical protein
MGLLAGVGADVTGLVLQTVEGLVAERALVGPGEILARLVLAVLLGILQEGGHEADGSGSHVRLGSGGGRRRGCRVVERVRLVCGGVRVEYGGQVEGLHVISTRGGV